MLSFRAQRGTCPAVIWVTIFVRFPNDSGAGPSLSLRMTGRMWCWRAYAQWSVGRPMLRSVSEANVGEKPAVAAKCGFVFTFSNPGVRHRCLQIVHVYEGAYLERLRACLGIQQQWNRDSQPAVRVFTRMGRYSCARRSAPWLPRRCGSRRPASGKCDPNGYSPYGDWC